MKRKDNIKLWVAAVIILVIIITAAFLVVFFQPQKQETIKMGAILSLSGSAAYYGERAQMGIEIAKEEMAALYPNMNFTVTYEDSFYTAKGGVDAYQKIKNTNQVDAVITGGSQVSLPIQPLSTQDGILQMAIFSSVDKYTSPDDLTFRVSTRNEIEAGRMAEFIKTKNFKRFAIIYLNNDFGVGFKETLKDLIEKENNTQIVSEEGYLLDTNDFRTHLLKISQQNPDAIFMVGVARDYALIMKQAKEMDMNIQFLSMRSAEDPVLIKTAGEAAEGLIYTYPFDASSRLSETEKFVTSFKAKYNITPDAYAAEGYEGFRLTALAFAECGKDYECIKSFLTELKDYKSIFGNLSFDSNGDVRYEFFLKTVKNGIFVKYGE